MENNRESENKEIVKTVGDLKRDLESYPDGMELYFEGYVYYRTKQREKNLLQIELREKKE
jgi:hypothetical protein|tara:strand:- start:6347 stop:6526 length:180 start_codon:yes stop_codon:yes gene_type:complete